MSTSLIRGAAAIALGQGLLLYRGGAETVRRGQAGERLAGIKGPKTPVEVPGTGRIRIPDKLRPKTLEEVKYVKSLSLTQQIRDFLEIAKATGRGFVLKVRQTTKLSRPLQEAVGKGIKKTLP